MTIAKTITIFLVDDNALYLKNLEIAFASKPYYKIVTFATGELCLEQMALKPDIIILDYYLNSVKKDSLNGLEILKKIRAINSEVPVVMLSVETSPVIAQNCLDNDANEFIIKSDICFARLREIITTVLIDKQHENKGNLISNFKKAFVSAALVVITIILSFFHFK
jgi:two-component system OmpR family response regulator